MTASRLHPARPLSAKLGLASLACALACLCCGGDAVGGSSRQAALAGAGDFFEDSHDIRRWYGTLPAYAGLLQIDLGRVIDDRGDPGDLTGQELGMYLDLAGGRFGTAGLLLAADDGRRPAGGATTLFWSRSGRRVNLGLMAGFRDAESASGSSASAVHDLRSEHDLNLGVGLRLDVDARTYLDLALETTGADRSLVENGRILVDRQEDFGTWSCRLRLFRSLLPDLALVGAWEYRRLDQIWLDETRPLPADLEEDVHRVGLAFNYFPDADTMVLLGAEYEDIDGLLSPLEAGWGTADPWRHRGFSLFVGLETRTRSWLTLRGGVRSRLSKIENTPALAEDFDPDVDGHVEETARRLELDLGLALHLGDFDLDLVLNEEPLYRLGHFLTGGDGDDTANFSEISLTYRF